MFDPKKLIEGIFAILKLIFPAAIPSWLRLAIGYTLLVALFLITIHGLLVLVSKIRTVWMEQFWPLLYSRDQRAHAVQRQRFADYIYNEIRRLNVQEEWRDHRFAELEAEIEAEGDKKSGGLASLVPFRRRTLRRERSLSRALEKTQEHLIILEGDPGAGKSVALRHVAFRIAHRATNSRSTESLIPVYVNLKELHRRGKQPVDRGLIQDFVLESLKRINDRDVHQFVDMNFEGGLLAGTWLFLFDSFDEIPDILSSTESDPIIIAYSSAISDFLGGMNQCRGVIASRYFRGPKQSGLPRFRVLPLSYKRRRALIRKTELSLDLEGELIAGLESVTGFSGMAENPMFLGLVCEYVRETHAFPPNSFSVFEQYVRTRIERDEERLRTRFHLTAETLRSTAERVAFCIAADDELGLSPTRRQIMKSLQINGFPPGEAIAKSLDALEFIKLGRSDAASAAGHDRVFTFAHRRFQEYFATSVVLREPSRVSTKKLLWDARWRETAVVLFQTQPTDSLTPWLSEISKDLGQIVAELELERTSRVSLMEFPWPAGVLHLASMLQDGFANRLLDLPLDIRTSLAWLLHCASSSGTLLDRKLALEVSGAIDHSDLLALLRQAFASNSQWLKDVAYRQVGRLDTVPSDLDNAIRTTLLKMGYNRKLRTHRLETRAHLSRFDRNGEFLATLDLLLWTSSIDYLIQGILFGLIWSLAHPRVLGFLLALAVLAISRLMLLWTWHSILARLLFQNSFSVAQLAFIRVTVALMVFSSVISGHNLRFGRTQNDTLRDFFPRIILHPLKVISSIKTPSFSDFSGKTALLYLFAIYAQTWALGALYAARTGFGTKRLYWPLLPVVPLISFVREPSTITRRIVRWVKEGGLIRKIKSGLVGLIALIIALGIMGAIAAMGEVGWVTLQVILGLLLGSASLMMIFDLIKRLRDELRYHRLRRDPQFTTVAELIEYLKSLNSEAVRVRLLRFARRTTVIQQDPNSELIFKTLALHLEKGNILTDYFPPSCDGSFEPPPARKHMSTRRHRDNLVLLDEVSLTLEEVRALLHRQ